MSFAVFGDSYVSRLEHFTISKGDLNLNTKCKFYGVPGMGTTYKFESTFNRLCHDRPKAVFIILGGNSITTKTTPNTIFEELKRAVELLKMHGTERVFVCGIVTRGNFREYGMDKTTFDKMRKSINEKLKKFMKSDYVDLGRFVKYPTHYDNDKVHPSQSGLLKIRSCVECAFRTV